MGKKKNYKIWTLVLIIFTVFVVVCLKVPINNTNEMFSVFKGEVISYEETGEGVVLIVDTISASTNRKFIITDKTIWLSSEIKEQILDCVTGVWVTITSQYNPKQLKNNPYGIYPIDSISEYYPQ